MLARVMRSEAARNSDQRRFAAAHHGTGVSNGAEARSRRRDEAGSKRLLYAYQSNGCNLLCHGSGDWCRRSQKSRQLGVSLLAAWDIFSRITETSRNLREDDAHGGTSDARARFISK